MCQQRLRGKKAVEVAAAAATSTFNNSTLYDREEGTKLVARIRQEQKEGQYDREAKLAVECFKTLNAYKPLRQFFRELVLDSVEARGGGDGGTKTKLEDFDVIVRTRRVRQHDIGRLQIPVHHATFMSNRETIGDLAGN